MNPCILHMLWNDEHPELISKQVPLSMLGRIGIFAGFEGFKNESIGVASLPYSDSDYTQMESHWKVIERKMENFSIFLQNSHQLIGIPNTLHWQFRSNKRCGNQSHQRLLSKGVFVSIPQSLRCNSRPSNRSEIEIPDSFQFYLSTINCSSSQIWNLSAFDTFLKEHESLCSCCQVLLLCHKCGNIKRIIQVHNNNIADKFP